MIKLSSKISHMEIKKTIKKYSTAYICTATVLLFAIISIMPMGVLLLVQPIFWIILLVVSGLVTRKVFKIWDKLFGDSTED